MIIMSRDCLYFGIYRVFPCHFLLCHAIMMKCAKYIVFLQFSTFWPNHLLERRSCPNAFGFIAIHWEVYAAAQWPNDPG